MIKVDVKEVRQRMREAVKAAGYPLYAFARQYGFGNHIFYDVKSIPSSYSLLVVSEKTGVSVDWLLKGDKA